MDGGISSNNHIPITYNISDTAAGGEYILAISDQGATDPQDINRPITTKIRYMFGTRFGLGVNDPEFYRLMNEEMRRGYESEAKLPLITSDGEETFVRFKH